MTGGQQKQKFEGFGRHGFRATPRSFKNGQWNGKIINLKGLGVTGSVVSPRPPNNCLRSRKRDRRMGRRRRSRRSSRRRAGCAIIASGAQKA